MNNLGSYIKLSLFDKALNIGINEAQDNIQTIRYIRQVNGLNIFYIFVALIGGIFVQLFLPGSFLLVIIQYVATLFYIFNIFLNYKRQYKLSSRLTIHFFEFQLFTIMLLTNLWQSSTIFIVTVYPLLAVLVEASIFLHLLISIIQICFLMLAHFLFPGVENTILNFTKLDLHASEILKIFSIIIIPVIGTMIINIIYKENIRTREKQKAMLNEISLKNRQLEVYANQLQDETQRLSAEIEIARRIQTMVLPTEEEIKKIDNLEIACLMRPAAEVGGDYYDVIKIDETVTIAIGDVTDHGLASGLVMLMAQTAIRTIAELKILDPSQFLSILNRVLYANILRIKEEKNMTLVLLSFYNDKFYISGQHESIIILRQNGQIEVIDTNDYGFYLGFLPDISEQLNTFELSLNCGDLLFLYSDGVTEAENEKEEQFGLENIKRLLYKYKGLPAEVIKFKFIKELYNFIGERDIYDDISFIIIKK
jgi:serine phosphatase RsbU (regulator of sigma subunit)